MRRQEVLEILASHREDLHQMGVKSLAVFGSVARDEARDDSDIDLLVEFDPPTGLFGFHNVHLYLEQIFSGKKIDLVMPDAIYEELRDEILGESVHAA